MKNALYLFSPLELIFLKLVCLFFRNIVESQMSNMRAKYEEMKASYDSKVAQLHKVKMHNVALLNMASGVGGSGKGEANAEQVQRLTELLEAEKSRTKMLMERIEVGANLLPDRTSHDNFPRILRL